MKTIKQTFAALLLIAALVLLGGLLAYSQDRPTPTPPVFPDCTEDAHHNCVGTCPTLWAAGETNALPVQPYRNLGGSDCHKIKGNCQCEYRTGRRYGNTCDQPDPQSKCTGTCPPLYHTPQDAQNHTNPIDFATHDCHTFHNAGGGTDCMCLYSL
jgi:hypothetical protein